MRSLPLFVVAAALSAPAGAQQPPWTFEVGSAGVGAPIYYRLAWTNTSEAPLRVPSDLLSRHTLHVTYCPPRGCRQPVRIANALVLRGHPARASSIAWSTVEPGQALELSGDLARAAPDQCSARGCVAGTYTLRVDVAPRDLAERADDQQVPSGAWTETVSAIVQTIGVRDAASVAVSARFTRTATGLRATATLTNRLLVPLWVPGKAAVFAECPVTIVERDGGEGMTETRSAAGGQSPYDETEAHLLLPGGQVVITYDCEVAIPAGARHVDAALRLVPFRPFQPTRATSPLYFAGVALSPKTRVF